MDFCPTWTGKDAKQQKMTGLIWTCGGCCGGLDGETGVFRDGRMQVMIVSTGRLFVIDFTLSGLVVIFILGIFD